jgi:hypothetical protein
VYCLSVRETDCRGDSLIQLKREERNLNAQSLKAGYYFEKGLRSVAGRTTIETGTGKLVLLGGRSDNTTVSFSRWVGEKKSVLDDR